MLRARPKSYIKPERPPMAWPGPQAFAPASRCDGAGAAQPKTVEQRNPHLLNMARGRPCLLHVPGICTGNRESVVACHSNWSVHEKGGARKADDHYSVWGCGACHTWLDRSGTDGDLKQATFMRAHLDQVLAWRRIVSDMSNPPKDRAAAHWALCLLEATPTGETP